LADFLTLCPEPASRNPSRALRLAHRAPETAGVSGHAGGIALYETGDYAAAFAQLERFVTTCGLSAADGRLRLARIYLAMARFRLGDGDGAARELGSIRRDLGEPLVLDWQMAMELRRATDFIGK
jgi:hypothetical protein